MGRSASVCALASLVAIVALVWGCGESGGETIEVSLDDLPCERETEDGQWESHPWPPLEDDACRWFPFSANNTYVFEHPLGRVPTLVVGYIAFGSDGVGATVASGNVLLVNGADASTVTLKNDQNQDFSLRLVLQ